MMSSHGAVKKAVALAAAVSLVVTASPTAMASPEASRVAARAGGPTCSVPVVQDVYDGFHVGVPNGWDLSTLGGEISVAPSPASTEGVLLYPALLTKGVTPSRVFASFMRYEQKEVQETNGSFSYRDVTGAGGLPGASVSATIDGTSLRGLASVRALPISTQLASREALVSLVYAPASQLAADAPVLSAVGRCYGPRSAALFSVFKGNPFTFIMPPGWHVGAEGQDDLELDNSANTASATFELWGPFVQGVNVSQALSTPAEAIEFWFSRLGFASTELLSTTKVGQDEEYAEFTASLGGKPVHGLMYMLISTSGQTTAGVFRLALADSGQWDPLNGALIEMAGSIQHNFTQDLEEIQAVNREWQDFSGQVANFDDTLNNQQLVQDPTTGQYYEAPYSSYAADGPDGPGYYLPSGQRLSEVERP